MIISVILGHPSKESFNHAIADSVVATLRQSGHHVLFHDLYEERFNPVLPVSEIPKNADTDPLVKKHCEEIVSTDGIVIVHPNWWGQPPAIVKGWIDRVIRPGVAYEFKEGDSGEGVPCGLLKATTALVFNTSNTSEERERAVFGDPLETIWKNCIFGLCGITNVHRRTFGIVVTSTEMMREAWLGQVRAMVDCHFNKAQG
jgi:NAD(P)H dehydrogenase (quinone)